MPRQTTDREDVLTAALEMTRRQGYERVNARSVAAFLGCSVQPIYSYFANMDELKESLRAKALEFYGRFIYARADKRQMLESMGRANVAFAREEPNLFRLLFLTKLSGNRSFADIFEWMGDKDAAAALAAELGVTEDKAREVYLMLIVFTHGIATMLATGGADISDAETSALLTKAFTAFVDLQKKE